METYIVTIYAKEDHASDVQEYYQDLQNTVSYTHLPLPTTPYV